jgi:hypothetical protein
MAAAEGSKLSERGPGQTSGGRVISTFIAGESNRLEVYTTIEKGGRGYETPVFV